ncbi:MAG TPA: hypothetical protein VHQ93_13300 [Chitinophagaceae bacterium]|jgi:hypothetical protein|nr:hypothetical protein [Chitinophagaceae bacterium]
MLLPFYYTTSIKTNLSEQQVKDILYNNTVTDNGKTFKDKRAMVLNRQQFKNTETNYLYKAKIHGKTFRLYRILEGPVGGKPRNSFNPLCFGKLYHVDNECIIELTFRSVMFVLLFMFIWTSAAVFGILAIFISSLSEGKYQDALFALVLAIPFYLGFWFFNKFGFKKEVDKTLYFFNNIGLTKNVT